MLTTYIQKEDSRYCRRRKRRRKRSVVGGGDKGDERCIEVYVYIE